MSIEVKETAESITLNLPVSKDEMEDTVKKLGEKLKRFAEDASEKFNLSLDEVLSCLPSNIEMQSISLEAIKSKKSSVKKEKPTVKSEGKSKITLDNWESAETKESLKSLKIDSLKNILSLKGLSITGSKQILIDRVWSILHETDAGETTKKPRKKKSKTKKSTANPNIVNDSDNEDEVSVKINDDRSKIEIMLEKSSTVIYVDNESLDVYESKETSHKTTECLLIPIKQWVFKNNENTVEFWGIIVDDKLHECDPPQKLLEMSV